jgi:uncharacterized protein
MGINTRRRFLKAMATTAGAGLLAGLYTWQYEPHWLEVVQRPLPLPRLPQAWHGARLVQLSDLHIGPQVDESYLQSTFEQVRDLKPDLVVYTGDFVSHDSDTFARAERMFRYLPLGSRATLGVLGNHDYGYGWREPEVAARLSAIAGSVGVSILRNEVVDVDGLQIAGLDDVWARHFSAEQAFTDIDSATVSLALSHNPDSVDKPGWGEFQGWVLAGHTHGGQCKPPFLPPPMLPVKNRRYTAGAFELSAGRSLYISRGVGHTLQVRFNVRPEITVFDLQSA